MRHVRRLIGFTGGYFWPCAAFGTVLFCVLPGLLGLATKAFFDAFAADAGINVWTAIAAIAALELCEVVAELGVSRAWSGFSYKTHTLLQRNLFDGILRGYARHGLPVPPGDAINRFRDDPPIITMGSMDGICDLIGRGIFAVVAVVVMASIDPVLMAAAFAPVIISAALADPLGTRGAKYGAAARESTAALTGFLGEVVSAQLAIRVSGAVPRVISRLSDVGEQRRKLSLRDRVFMEIVNSMNFHLVHVATGAVLLLGAGRIRNGSFSVGDFALFVVYLDQLTYLPAEIGRVLTELKRTAVSIDRMHALMPGEGVDAVVAPAAVYLREPPPALPAAPARLPLERLDVEHLSYVHPSSGRGIADVSFSIERGTCTVVTGRVGAGKSTLLHAVIGLVQPDAGSVRWNGVVVDDPSTFFVPPRSAFTPQVPRLLSQSLRANLTFGRQVGEDELRAALHAGVLEDDVERLSGGLDTLVGTRGVKLSGGQIQRSAAARMFLGDPELLVLDDLSSALDGETEAELWRRLFELRGDVTCLVVSHSPIARRHAHQVLVLEEGRIR